MKTLRSILAGWFALGVAVEATAAPAPDAFLDAPVTKEILSPWTSLSEMPANSQCDHSGTSPLLVIRFDTLQQRLAALNKWLPRRLVLPSGLAEFIAKVDSRRDAGNMLFPFDGEGAFLRGPKPPTYRDFLNESCLMMGMHGYYDAKQDCLVADFSWCRDDPRSPADLLSVLAETKPMATDEAGWPTIKSSGLDTNAIDPWRRALDALLSKPGNHEVAWQERFVDDTKGATFCPSPGTILWSGWVRNWMNQREFLVLKFHPALSMPGPVSSFDCYVFDPQGRFIGGKVLADRYEAFKPPQVQLSLSGRTLDFYRGTELVARMSLGWDGINLSPEQTFSGDYFGKSICRAGGG